AKVVEGIRQKAGAGAAASAWFNVNFPFCPPDEVEGIRVVPTKRFSRSPRPYYATDNPGKFFIAIQETPKPLDPQNDFHQLMHGNAITVTPVALQATDAALAARMDGALALR